MKDYQKYLSDLINHGGAVSVFSTPRSNKSVWNQMYDEHVLASAPSDVRVSTGAVFGQKYHTVVLVGGWDVTRRWCTEQFGGCGDVHKNTNARWYENSQAYWFRDEDDVLAFILRWK